MQKHPDADAFMRSYLEHPTDAISRLVFADWLEETGEPHNTAWAHFIRLRIEADRYPSDKRRAAANSTAKPTQYAPHIRASLTIPAQKFVGYPKSLLQLLPAPNITVRLKGFSLHALPHQYLRSRHPCPLPNGTGRAPRSLDRDRGREYQEYATSDCRAFWAVLTGFRGCSGLTIRNPEPSCCALPATNRRLHRIRSLRDLRDRTSALPSVSVISPMHELFEHTADLGLRATAPDLNSLFVEMAKCLVSAMLEEPAAVQPVQEVRIELAGNDREFFLFDWLKELLLRFETDRLLFASFDVQVTETG